MKIYNKNKKLIFDGAYLSGADLTGANLNGADLRNVVFRNADLRNAVFRNADLRGADFRNADLTDADLRGADLNGADLRGADFRNADLTDANLPIFCKWLFSVKNSDIIQIGCKEYNIEDWDNFFSEPNEKQFETPRNTPEFLQIKAVYNALKAYLQTFKK